MLTLVLVATVGAWIGFANPLFHFPLAALAFPLALAWIGLRATSARKAFKYGWLAGLLAGTGCFYWMVIPVQYYGGLPWAIALPCPVLLAAFMGLYYGLFSLIIYYAGQCISGTPLCLMAGLVWTSMEMLMGSFLSGFPWMNLASAFAPWPIAIQGASLVGAYGLSGVLTVLAVATLLYSTYRSALLLASALTLSLIAFGWYSFYSDAKTPPDYSVAIVQGNVDQGQKWEPDLQKETIEKYAKLSLEAIESAAPRVVIWPETAMPFYIQDQSPFREAVLTLAKESKTPIITGSPAYRVVDMKTRKYVLLNRAWLIDDTGRATQSYDKEHLVPFGEYMPFEKWIPFKKLVQAAGDFVPGRDNKPIVLDSIALGMLICYEGIFPELAQRQVELGASALLNISNDAWFGDTSAPRQHLNLTIMRAVEQGRWLVRSTNTGISAFISPEGRLTAVSTQFQAEALDAKINPLNDKTVFHQLFPWLGPSIYIVTLLALVWLIIAGRQRQ